MIKRLGARMLLYRHQKSSTVLKVYTLRRVWPHVACFWRPLGLSNHSVHVCSKGCFAEKSGVESAIATSITGVDRVDRARALWLRGAAARVIEWESSDKSLCFAFLDTKN